MLNDFLLIYLFIVAAILFRITMLFVSIRNEKALRANGATEYGATNSRILAIVHTGFYLAAVVEWSLRHTRIDDISVAGFGLYVFGIFFLLVVVHLLGRLWTVKLLIAHNHVLTTHPLFRLVRHPNYYLNILPELIGYGLVLHSYFTILIGLPIYLVPLIARIKLEEKVMRNTFSEY
ncbi:MAG: isoprenylcysteine carboxylmethyltransferase family protein [Janthinobacterium lividum]